MLFALPDKIGHIRYSLYYFNNILSEEYFIVIVYSLHVVISILIKIYICEKKTWFIIRFFYLDII